MSLSLEVLLSVTLDASTSPVLEVEIELSPDIAELKSVSLGIGVTTAGIEVTFAFILTVTVATAAKTLTALLIGIERTAVESADFERLF